MTRAYYTDPLAAAWMGLHHGVKFGITVNRIHWMDDIFYQCETQGRVYIHPDSMALLAWRINDLVLHKGKPYYVHSSIGEPHITEPIIQRNGIAFHWPEFEA